MLSETGLSVFSNSVTATLYAGEHVIAKSRWFCLANGCILHNLHQAVPFLTKYFLCFGSQECFGPSVT